MSDLPDGPATEDENLRLLERSFIARHKGDPRVFGDPDGARAELSDFIDIEELSRSTYFSPEPGRVRVVIGRKGSGKTLYLRKLRQDIMADRSLIYASPDLPAVVTTVEQTQLLRTEQVVRVAHLYPEAYLTEIWQLCWGRAIILAAASQLVFNQAFAPYVSESERSDLQSDFAQLFGSMKAARAPFTTIKQLLEAARTRKALSRRLDNPLWDDLEARVAALLEDCPPLYFLIDAIDEDFAHAPAYWMRCQKGLFYETMRLLRNSKLGGRLHVIVSIRDVVFYSVFRSEHASRYVGDPHIQTLDWGYAAARAFLDAKVARLPAAVRSRTERTRSLAAWVGFDRVTNALGTEESVYDYALRHTQCLPRDVVAFGNLLGEALSRSAAVGQVFSQSDFREVVADVARLSGLTQISVVANQVVADEMPAEATAYDFQDVYLSVLEYKKDRVDRVIEIIRGCGYLRIDRAVLLELQNAGRAEFNAPDLASILWQAGLLGVENGSASKAVFFSFDRMGRLRLPMHEERYVFHPSMREVAGLRPRGAPVVWNV